MIDVTKTPFAMTSDDRLYVRVEAVMHPMIPFADGLPMTLFGDEKEAYLTMDEAIKWCKNEQEHGIRTADRAKILEILEKAKRGVLAGKFIET